MKRPEPVASLEARSFSLDDLVGRVVDGKVRLPSFQRQFRWGRSDVTRLFDSIYKGYPIGTLLMWTKPAGKGIISFGGVTWEAPKLDEAYWVVDGQQRITALALSVASELRTGPIDPRFNIFFDLETEEFHSVPQGSDSPSTWLPLDIAFDLESVLDWSAELGLDRGERSKAFVLTKRLRDYQVPAYLVEAQDEMAVREIFDRMNTFGKSMQRAEIFEALHSSPGDDPGTRLSSLSLVSVDLGFGEIKDAQLLHVVLSTRGSGSDVLRDFRSEFEDKNDRALAFVDARAALALAVNFMKNDADMPHVDLVPYQHLLVALVRFFHFFPDPEPRVRVLLRRWFWRAAMAGPSLTGGTTGTLRKVVGAVAENDVNGTLERLFQLTGTKPSTNPELPTTLRRTNADMRIALAALFSLNPTYSEYGSETNGFQAVEAASVLSSDSAPIPKLLLKEASSFENLLLLPRGDDSRIDLLADSTTNDNTRPLDLSEFRRSHGISLSFLDLIGKGQAHNALLLRRKELAQLVIDFVDSHTEWDLPDRASISSLGAEHG